jgi:hyperosmotically inducible protein
LHFCPVPASCRRPLFEAAMRIPPSLTVLVVLALLPLGGCAVTDRQSTVSQYMDDAAITLRVKSRMAQDPRVSAMRINVETLNGTVQLSGFAASAAEKTHAARLAAAVDHVDQVRNNIIVRTAER